MTPHWQEKYVRRRELTEKEFYQRHNMRVIDTNKRFQRYKPWHKSDFFNYKDSKEIVDTFHVDVQTESLYTVEIPKNDLDKMREFEQEVYNNLYCGAHYRMFEVIMEQKEQEKFYREKYSAVKKAFEHYSLMLALAKSGDIK
jgi:hypothetical protein